MTIASGTTEPTLEFQAQVDMDALERELIRLDQFRGTQMEGRDVVVQLGSVLWFDIGTLLMLIGVMNHLRSKGNTVRIVLPAHQKALDYLKRWQFGKTLDDNVGRHEDMMTEQDLQRFHAPLEFYKPKVMSGPLGPELIASQRLFEIHSFTGFVDQHSQTSHAGRSTNAEKHISVDEIQAYVTHVEDATLRRIVEKSLGVTNVEVFSRAILKEALLNTEEHPNASISLVAVSREGNHLVVAVYDNGVGIPETIREAYLKELRRDGREVSDVELLTAAFHTKSISYATKAGTTSIPPDDPRSASRGTTRGMGLYYIKTETLKLGGFLKVRSGRAYVSFTADKEPEGAEVRPWDGTLLKIYLPLKG